MSKKLTIEEIKEYALNNTTAKVLSEEYKGNKSKLLFECGCEDKNKFERTWSKFKNAKQQTCLKCSLETLRQKCMTSNEKILTYFKNTKSKLIEAICINKVTELKIECECGEKYTQRIQDFKRSPYKLCPKCSNELKAINRRHSQEKVIKEIESFGLNLLSEYENIDKDMKIQCSCGNEFYSSLWKLRAAENKVCKECLSKLKSENFDHDEENFVKRLPNNVELLSEYKGLTKFVDIRFKNCGHVETRRANNVVKRNKDLSCKICNTSAGEQKIESYLIKNNIKYEPQKRFDECKNIRPLPFDFYLPDYNILIEYQGQGHFERQRLHKLKDIFGGFSEFLRSKKRDLIKKKFCREHKDLKLLEIMYYEYSQVHNILKYSLMR